LPEGKSYPLTALTVKIQELKKHQVLLLTEYYSAGTVGSWPMYQQIWNHCLYWREQEFIPANGNYFSYFFHFTNRI